MGQGSASWAEVDRRFVRLDTIPDAVKSLAALRAVARRWSQAVEVRASMHELVFVLPAATHPLERAVELRWGSPAMVHLMRRGFAQDSVEVSLESVDTVLDRALTWLCDGTIWCARCGGQVVASADRYAVYEHMHWVCFHYEFEHGSTDVDQGCADARCPSRSA